MSEILAAIDFDRTLGNTVAISAAFAEALSSSHQISAEQIHEAQSQAELTGVSFDPHKYVRDELKLNDKQFAVVEHRFYELADSEKYRHDMLFPDALPFMDHLAKLAVPTVIMTYGNPEWQKMKLRSVGLDVWPHVLTTHKYKGEEIASWKDPDTGIFHPKGIENPTFYAANLALRKVVLVDDKAASFRGFPEDSEGYLLQRMTAAILPSQSGSIPANVTRIGSLAEIDVESTFNTRIAA